MQQKFELKNEDTTEKSKILHNIRTLVLAKAHKD